MKINKFEFSGSFRTPSRSAHKNYISITGECRWRNMHLEFRGMQWFFLWGGGLCCAYVYQWHFFNSYVIKKPIPHDSIFELYGTPPKS